MMRVEILQGQLKMVWLGLLLIELNIWVKLLKKALRKFYHSEEKSYWPEKLQEHDYGHRDS